MTEQKIYEDELDVRWYYREGINEIRKIKTYVVVCRCGGRPERLFLLPTIVSCQVCGKAHSYTAFAKERERAEKARIMGDGIRGRIKQWIPESTGTKQIDKRTGKVTSTSLLKYWDILNKKINHEFVCPKCKRKYKWTAHHYVQRISQPLLVVNGQEQCYQCVRDVFKSDK